MKRPAITPAMRLETFKTYGAVVLCQLCGSTQRIADMALDHWQALIDGGEHHVTNLRPVCTECHKPKSANEHKNNAKAKRLAKATETHEAIVAKVQEKAPGKIPSRPWPKQQRKFGS